MGSDEGSVPQDLNNGLTLHRNQVGEKIWVISFGIWLLKVNIVENREYKITAQEDENEPDNWTVFFK